MSVLKQLMCIMSICRSIVYTNVIVSINVMAAAELKNKKNKKSVQAFLKSRAQGKRLEDAQYILKLMEDITNEKPVMWGESIVGFGEQHLVYASGREIDWMKIGFSVRKDRITLYLTCNLDRFQDYLDKLGPHSRGVGCLHIKKFEDVHKPTLRQMIRRAYKTAGKH